MKSVYDSNEKLIKGLMAGEEEAYSQLVEIYHHSLCVYADSLINDSAAAEDIVQNVLIRIWEKRMKLRTDHSIKSFLYRSVYNEFIDQYRKIQSVSILERKYIEALDAMIEKDEAAFENKILLVRKEIENLPPKCKTVFLMSKKDGLSNVEISENLNISTKTVEAHILRAFKIIRERVHNKLNLESIFFLLFKVQRKNTGVSQIAIIPN